MTPSIRNAKTRQRRKERGMTEIRLWLDPRALAGLEAQRAAWGLRTNAEALVRLIPTFEPMEHPF